MSKVQSGEAIRRWLEVVKRQILVDEARADAEVADDDGGGGSQARPDVDPYVWGIVGMGAVALMLVATVSVLTPTAPSDDGVRDEAAASATTGTRRSDRTDPYATPSGGGGGGGGSRSSGGVIAAPLTVDGCPVGLADAVRRTSGLRILSFWQHRAEACGDRAAATW